MKAFVLVAVLAILALAAPARGATYTFIQEVPVGGSWPITINGNGTAKLTLYLKDGSLWYTTGEVVLQPGLPSTIQFPAPAYSDDSWTLDLNITEAGVSVHHTLSLKTYCNIECQRIEWGRERAAYMAQNAADTRLAILVVSIIAIVLLLPGAALRTHDLYRHNRRDRDIPLSWRLHRPRWFLQPHESSKGGDTTLAALQSRENALEAQKHIGLELMELGKYGEKIVRVTSRGKRFYGLVSDREIGEAIVALKEHRLKYRQSLITLRRSLQPPLIAPGVPRTAVEPLPIATVVPAQAAREETT